MTTKPEEKKNVIQTMDAQSTAVAVRPSQLKPKRMLTMDATSIARLGQVVMRCEGELEVIDMPPRAKGDKASKAVAVPITDVENDKRWLLICNSLLVSALRRAGEPLAGRYFAAVAGEIKAGKSYRHIDVMELEVAK